MSSPRDGPSRREALLRAVGHDLGRHRSALATMFHSAVADALGLNITDLKCFDLLLRAEEPVTAKRLAEQSGLTTAAITGVADRLERGNFVRRVAHPNDRRQVIIEPLPAAGRRVSALYDPLARAMSSLAESYSDEELETIADYLARGSRVLDEETAKLRQPAQRLG